MLELIKQPWSWWAAGIIIGLTVPTLLILGNKSFGISSSMRHLCAMCFPAKLPFFNYNWKKEIWNIFFIVGVALGGFVAVQFLGNDEPVKVAAETQHELREQGVTSFGVGNRPDETTVITSLVIVNINATSFNGGTYVLYGVK